jgi:hypothetical protein
MLSCKEVSHLVSESLDRKLPFHLRLQMRIHLLMCRFCSRFRKQVLFVRGAARRFLTASEEADIRPGSGLSPEARNRIKQALKPRPN